MQSREKEALFCQTIESTFPLLYLIYIFQAAQGLRHVVKVLPHPACHITSEFVRKRAL